MTREQAELLERISALWDERAALAEVKIKAEKAYADATAEISRAEESPLLLLLRGSTVRLRDGRHFWVGHAGGYDKVNLARVTLHSTEAAMSPLEADARALENLGATITMRPRRPEGAE